MNRILNRAVAVGVLLLIAYIVMSSLPLGRWSAKLPSSPTVPEVDLEELVFWSILIIASIVGFTILVMGTKQSGMKGAKYLSNPVWATFGVIFFLLLLSLFVSGFRGTIENVRDVRQAAQAVLEEWRKPSQPAKQVATPTSRFGGVEVMPTWKEVTPGETAIPKGKWSETYSIGSGCSVRFNSGNGEAYQIRYAYNSSQWKVHVPGSFPNMDRIQFAALTEGLTKIPFVIRC